MGKLQKLSLALTIGVTIISTQIFAQEFTAPSQEKCKVSLEEIKQLNYEQGKINAIQKTKSNAIIGFVDKVLQIFGAVSDSEEELVNQMTELDNKISEAQKNLENAGCLIAKDVKDNEEEACLAGVQQISLIAYNQGEADLMIGLDKDLRNKTLDKESKKGFLDLIRDAEKEMISKEQELQKKGCLNN